MFYLFIPYLSIRDVKHHHHHHHHERKVTPITITHVSRRRTQPLSSIVSSINVDLSPLPSEQSLPNALLETFLERTEPRAIQLVRRPLEQPFAVLMMRSGYNAVDDLDFVAMDVFQARFFDIRSREWEKYLKKNNGTVRQGFITDAQYFDFISYAQMLTIQYFMRSPRTVFEEKVAIDVDRDDAGFQTRVIKRNTQLYPTCLDILKAWQSSVGHSIYNHIIDNVHRPLPLSSSTMLSLNSNERKQVVKQKLEQIYSYFLRVGYCLGVQWVDSNNDNNNNGNDMVIATVELTGPCILWGNQVLTRRKSIPNDYDCLCVEAFGDQSGIVLGYSTTYSENAIFRTWKLL